MMKNLPNQSNDLGTAKSTLHTIDVLHQQGQPVSDDGVLGYAMARHGAYTFRGLPFVAPHGSGRNAFEAALEARIAEQQTLDRATQGARTSAREARRLLNAMGWLDAQWKLTATGREFKDAPSGSELERLLLRHAVLNLTVEERSTGALSHPGRIILHLLMTGPSRNRHGLELALEAQDDSAEELNRVKALYKLSPADRMNALIQAAASRPGAQTASVTTIANAKKILPKWIVEAGLARENFGEMRITSEGIAALDITPEEIEVPSTTFTRRGRMRQPREVTAASAGGREAQTTRRRRTGQEQDASAAQLAARMSAHQQLVQALAEKIEHLGTLHEDPFSYDLLLRLADSDVIYLFEVKTVRLHDEDRQVRGGIGQLLWYSHFDVQGTTIHKVLVVDSDLQDDRVSFLNQLQINVLIHEQNDAWHTQGEVDDNTAVKILGFMKRLHQ